MKQISSYVMQDDQLFPMLTVLETLRFAAEVRLPPSLSREEKLKRVWELIEQLGLQVTPLLPSVLVLGSYFFKQKASSFLLFTETKYYYYELGNILLLAIQ